MPDPAILTLTTDFGFRDGFVGVMKGVILGIAPHAQIVDISHEIAPQNVLEGGLCLEAAYDYFPSGTVHLAVVDPGVGTERPAIVVETERHLFVAPDNGLLTFLRRTQSVRRVIELTEAATPYLLPQRSHTFHGRDVFAPIAARLAVGLPPETLGAEREPHTLVTLPLPEPQTFLSPDGACLLQGHIVRQDRFGNLITNVTPERFEAWKREASSPTALSLEIEAGDARWFGLNRTYAEVPIGAPLLYWGSAGRLEIGVRDGDAALQLRLAPGDRFSLRLQPNPVPNPN